MQIKQHKKIKNNNNSTGGDHCHSHSEKRRLLITVNVLGSAGPMRFVVNEDDVVSSVIETALRSYAREGRLPLLGTHSNDFLLYCANAGSDGTFPLTLSFLLTFSLLSRKANSLLPSFI